MEKMADKHGHKDSARGSTPPKTPPAASHEEKVSDEEGRSGSRKKHRKQGKPLLTRLFTSKGTHKKDGTASEASTCSSSSKRSDGGSGRPGKSPHHGGAHHKDSLEPVHGKDLKDHPDLVAHQGPKKKKRSGGTVDIPDAGQTIAAFTEFENDDIKGAQLADCHEKEAKLQMVGDEPKKKATRERKPSSKSPVSGKSDTARRSGSSASASGKSMESTRKKPNQRNRTRESPLSRESPKRRSGSRTPGGSKLSMEPYKKNVATPQKSSKQ